MPGALSIVLHAHLPFVRHPEHADFLEEDWLYEAISETYLPLLEAFDRLERDGVDFRVTMTLSPPLLCMLRDELLMSRYAHKLDKLCELGDREVERTRNEAAFQPLARYYRDHFYGLRHAFHEKYGRDLIRAFRRHLEAGRLEIITCGATHGFLPLMNATPEAVRAQITVACNQYRILFGRDPRGIWLPECGYYPGVERFLASEGLRFFFVDTHGITDATPRPIRGVYAPLFTENGVAAFGRDPESSQQVWSSEMGYPGDFVYREFYRDIGWDLPLDYVRPYVQPTGDRKNTGFKYFRITGKTDQKLPYDPELARNRAREHAADFVRNRERQLSWLSDNLGGATPIVVAPYDAELYGHWWFEGPHFLEEVFRICHARREHVKLTTPAEYLRDNPEQQVATPAQSSWGERGYANVWLDPSNDWIYQHLGICAARMVALARDFPDAPTLERRALNQAARELLLAQSSDWAFIMKTGTMVEYAQRRTKEHVLRFLRLHDQVRSNQIDESWLSRVEAKNNLFPELDYRVYRPVA